MTKNTDIQQTIQLWYEAKTTANDLDKKINKYRNYIEKYMDTNGLDKINLDNIALKRTLQTRENMAREHIPTDVWQKYKKETIFYTYYITPSKKK
jgi:hypothetical protein